MKRRTSKQKSAARTVQQSSPTVLSERRLVARDVRPDSRHRVSLGAALKNLGDASFAVYQDRSGRITLEPQVSVPAAEAWLFRNKTALESLRRGFDDLATGKTRKTGSFAEYAADEES